jgi:hypothetical protein
VLSVALRSLSLREESPYGRSLGVPFASASVSLQVIVSLVDSECDALRNRNQSMAYRDGLFMHPIKYYCT